VRDIADAKTLADADIPWLIQLENMIIARLKQPVDALVQAGQLPGVPSPGMSAGGLQGGGLMAGPMAPPPGEINRMLNVGGPGL
jgi:hypothetical protein